MFSGSVDVAGGRAGGDFGNYALGPHNVAITCQTSRSRGFGFRFLPEDEPRMLAAARGKDANGRAGRTAAKRAVSSRSRRLTVGLPILGLHFGRYTRFSRPPSSWIRS